MASTVEFRPGDRVTVRRGTWKFDNLILKNNTLIGVQVARRNPDRSYQIEGIIRTPEFDEVTVPADWIEPVFDSAPHSAPITSRGGRIRIPFLPFHRK